MNRSIPSRFKLDKKRMLFYSLSKLASLSSIDSAQMV